MGKLMTKLLVVGHTNKRKNVDEHFHNLAISKPNLTKSEEINLTTPLRFPRISISKGISFIRISFILEAKRNQHTL